LISEINSSQHQDGDGKPLDQMPCDEVMVVFDSIVAISRPIDAPDEVQIGTNFAFWCISLMQRCFRAKFPLRGVISAGDVLWDASRRMLLAPAQGRMVAMERDQQWSGAIVLPECEDLVLDAILGAGRAVGADQFFFPLVRHWVPMRDRSSDLWVLNWMTSMGELGSKLGLACLDSAKEPGTKDFLVHRLRYGIKYVRRVFDRHATSERSHLEEPRASSPASHGRQADREVRGGETCVGSDDE
jgi:hypothetical protein